ncbi:MAG: hypothetical protein MZV64_25965 [Ignavibacteriales bacterium]|nr:hypothetical protein [Ignavibacteriales bacterium]
MDFVALQSGPGKARAAAAAAAAIAAFAPDLVVDTGTCGALDPRSWSAPWSSAARASSTTSPARGCLGGSCPRCVSPRPWRSCRVRRWTAAAGRGRGRPGHGPSRAARHPGLRRVLHRLSAAPRPARGAHRGRWPRTGRARACSWRPCAAGLPPRQRPGGLRPRRRAFSRRLPCATPGASPASCTGSCGRSPRRAGSPGSTTAGARRASPASRAWCCREVLPPRADTGAFAPLAGGGTRRGSIGRDRAGGISCPGRSWRPRRNCSTASTRWSARGTTPRAARV